MAKLKGPLFSLGASGAIAKTLVYFAWKGLDVVREYVVPTNPQTTAQTTHRAYLTAAVAAIHAAQGLAANPLDEADKVAYALLGSIHKTPRTWFNQIVKLWLDCKVDADVPIIYCNGRIIAPSRVLFDITIEIEEETGSQLAAGKFFFGRTKTSLINSWAASVSIGDNVNIPSVDLSSILTAGVKYFVQFRPNSGDPCEGADSGIYSFVATA